MTASAVEAPEPDDATDLESRDLSVLIPGAIVIDVEGHPCRVRRLRSREVLDIARIIAEGVGTAVSDLNFDLDDADEFRSSVTALLVYALPNAERETFQFLRKMLVPADDADSGIVSELMQNPDIGVTLDILNTVMEQEGDGLVGLLGKAQALAGKVGNLLKPKTAKGPGPSKGGRSGRSRGRST